MAGRSLCRAQNYPKPAAGSQLGRESGWQAKREEEEPEEEEEMRVRQSSPSLLAPTNPAQVCCTSAPQPGAGGHGVGGLQGDLEELSLLLGARPPTPAWRFSFPVRT